MDFKEVDLPGAAAASLKILSVLCLVVVACVWRSYTPSKKSGFLPLLIKRDVKTCFGA